MKAFHIVGAFDRHNYGDLLFPLIHCFFIKKKLGDDAVVNYYSISESDMSDFGGVKTVSTRELVCRVKKDKGAVVMAGGDVLAADWVTMYGHISPGARYFLFRLVKKVFGFKVGNRLCQRYLSSSFTFPYVFSNEDVGSAVYYVGVGGTGFKRENEAAHLNEVASKLVSTNHVSIREEKTFRLLKDKGVPCSICPDSALVMTDLFSPAMLASRPWLGDVKVAGEFDEKRYFVFQAGRAFVSDVEAIAHQLSEISREAKISILLLPIGRASGHEDDIVLQDIFNILEKKGASVLFQNSPHILDIMASIAFAEAYIGTSLHGAITSYSFQKKVCGISVSKVPKLESFVKTWMRAGDYVLSEGLTFKDQFIDLLSTPFSDKGLDELAQQKEMVRVDIDKYILCESCS